MAQRAIRDGKELTYENYCRYGEWVNTEEIRQMGLANRTEIASMSPDYEMHIFACPWHSQFKEMGLKEAGLAYCRDLDASISRGFNPEQEYLVTQTLHDHEYCIQTVKNAGITENSKLDKNLAGLRSFEYHCAHLYWSFYEISGAIFGAEGEAAGRQVLQDFADEYGENLADILMGYSDTNFNLAE